MPASALLLGKEGILRSGYGHTAVVGGVVAVGLVLAVLSFAGGSGDSTDQETYPILLASAEESSTQYAATGTPVGATTTTAPGEPVVPDSNRAAFCGLAGEYISAWLAIAESGGQQADWEKQLEFYSIGATLVLPDGFDPVSGRRWREILLERSYRQSEMNLGLAAMAWDPGAYHDANSSSGVVGAPPIGRLGMLLGECGISALG